MESHSSSMIFLSVLDSNKSATVASSSATSSPARPKKADKSDHKDKHRSSIFLTLSPKRALPRTTSVTNMLGTKGTPAKSNSNTISVATGQIYKAPDLTCTDLFDAARKGDVNQAQLLRKKGMGINGIDSNGWSALHHAAVNGHLQVAEYLVSEGIKLDIQDLSGMTAFDRACLTGNENIAYYLWKVGAKFDQNSTTGKEVLRRSTLPKEFWNSIHTMFTTDPQVVWVKKCSHTRVVDL